MVCPAPFHFARKSKTNHTFARSTSRLNRLVYGACHLVVTCGLHFHVYPVEKRNTRVTFTAVLVGPVIHLVSFFEYDFVVLMSEKRHKLGR